MLPRHVQLDGLTIPYKLRRSGALNSGHVTLGVFNAAGGQNVRHLTVDGSNTGTGLVGDVTFNNTLTISGNVTADATE